MPPLGAGQHGLAYTGSQHGFGSHGLQALQPAMRPAAPMMAIIARAFFIELIPPYMTHAERGSELLPVEFFGAREPNLSAQSLQAGRHLAFAAQTGR